MGFRWTYLSAPLVVLFLYIPFASGHTDSSGYQTYTDKYGAVINSFKLHPTLKNWNDASADCEAEGAHLIIPNSESEILVVDRFYKMITGVDSKNELHVGFTDKAVEGTWKTVLGGSMADSNARPWLELWMPGEPNDVGDEDCASMDMLQMKYLDVKCVDENAMRAFVCEKEIAEFEDPEMDERIRI